jgi:plasmid maintenance system antidote protein VapI
MFSNLLAELTRENIPIKEFAKKIGVTEKSARNKLNGKTEFTLSEIQKTFDLFPDLKMDYLFQKKGA